MFTERRFLMKKKWKRWCFGGIAGMMLATSAVQVPVFASTSANMNEVAQWNPGPVIYNPNDADDIPNFDKKENVDYGDISSGTPLEIYQENESVTIKDLLSLVEAKDKDKEKFTLTVAKISYPTAEDGYQPADVLRPDKTSKVDTYFNHLKKDEEVTITVTYEAVDVAGNVTNQNGYIKVIYNNPPTITSGYLAYVDYELTEDEARVLKEIQNNWKATDKEDNVNGKTLTATITNPNPLKIDTFKPFGSHYVTYKVTDSLGKSAQVTGEVYVTTSDPYNLDKKVSIRFVNKKYLYTVSKESNWHKDNNPELWNQLVEICENAERENPTVQYSYDFITGDYKE